MARASLVVQIAGALGVAISAGAPAQQLDAPPLLARKNPTDWTLHAELFIGAYPDRGLGGGRYVGTMRIDKGVVVFPMIAGCATSELNLLESATELSLDGQTVDTEPTMLVNYQAGERMGRWDLPKVQGNQLRLVMDLPVRCWEVTLDEERARAVSWPEGAWPAVAQSALGPQAFVESDDPRVRALVERWTEGRPRSMRPYELAKFLAGKVIDHVQPIGEGAAIGRSTRFAGLDLAGAARVAETGRGSPHDLAALLCAVYRAAGLPARVVVGFDIPRSMGRDAQIFAVVDNCGGDESGPASNIPVLRTWVEFCLFDPAHPREPAGTAGAAEGAVAVAPEHAAKSAIPDPCWWIPVDVVRLREFSSRALPMSQPWPWFGSNDCMDNVVPLSFHFHPPTTVVGGHPGSPALFGWLATPDTPRSEHHLLFRAGATVKRGGQPARP